MTKSYSENTRWITLTGKKIRLKDLPDTHLANIMRMKESLGHFDEIYGLLVKITEKRGLTNDFINNAPYPYKNELGEWCIWNHKKSSTPRSFIKYFKIKTSTKSEGLFSSATREELEERNIKLLESFTTQELKNLLVVLEKTGFLSNEDRQLWNTCKKAIERKKHGTKSHLSRN